MTKLLEQSFFSFIIFCFLLVVLEVASEEVFPQAVGLPLGSMEEDVRRDKVAFQEQDVLAFPCGLALKQTTKQKLVLMGQKNYRESLQLDFEKGI